MLRPSFNPLKMLTTLLILFHTLTSALAIKFTLGALAQCGSLYISWSEAQDGDKKLICVPTQNNILAQIINISASIQSPYNVPGILFPQATDYICSLIDAGGYGQSMVSTVNKVTASTNTSCLQFPYSGTVVDGFFRLGGDGSFNQCGSMAFNWDASFTPPAELIALEVGGKVWKVFDVTDQGMTSSSWDKINVTAGGNVLLTFPDSGPKGTLGSTSMLTIGPSSDSSCLSKKGKDGGSGGSKKAPIGAIVGGAVGGVILLALLTLFLLFYLRRRKQVNDISHPRDTIFGAVKSRVTEYHPDLDGPGVNRSDTMMGMAAGRPVSYGPGHGYGHGDSFYGKEKIHSPQPVPHGSVVPYFPGMPTDRTSYYSSGSNPQSPPADLGNHNPHSSYFSNSHSTHDVNSSSRNSHPYTHAGSQGPTSPGTSRQFLMSSPPPGPGSNSGYAPSHFHPSATSESGAVIDASVGAGSALGVHSSTSAGPTSSSSQGNHPRRISEGVSSGMSSPRRETSPQAEGSGGGAKAMFQRREGEAERQVMRHEDGGAVQPEGGRQLMTDELPPEYIDRRASPGRNRATPPKQ